MNAYQTPSIAIRAASLLASVVVTALIVGSQFGLADAYAEQADGLLAAKSAQQKQAAQDTTAPLKPRS